MSFYGQSRAPEAIRELYDDLSEVWSAQTCAPRMRDRWSRENRTAGQCSVTAFLVQDELGGDVYGAPLGDGNYHCFNVIDGAVYDLTCEQFGGADLDYALDRLQSRAEHFAKSEKYERYLLLKERLAAYRSSKRIK